MTTLLRGGQVFDGNGGRPRRLDVLVDGKTVTALGRDLEAPAGSDVVDATGCWVTPGFIDLHTHYDAEVEVAPALSESVRHGITTVLVGSCGLSMAVGDPEDMADMFCRVEGIPREIVLPILEDIIDWDSPAGYLEHLGRLPLGPNVTAMLGHSTIRAAAMGLERSLTDGTKPTTPELKSMVAYTEEALDAGYLGLSINTLPWDKMGGTRFRSRPTPSVYASFKELRYLGEVLRRRDALFQVIPDVSGRLNLLPLMGMSTGLGRKPLRTSMVTMMDSQAAPGVYRLLGALGNVVNRRLGGDVRFQALPNPFDMFTDGLEVPLLEEIGAGTDALHIEDPDERATLLNDPAYRARFRKQWSNRFASRAYHRDLGEATIVDCPDPSLVGRSFADVALERGTDPIDAFLDLQVEHGNALRWYTVVANGNPKSLEWIMTHPAAVIGFSDAGAHLRNMGYYNFPLRMLKRVRDAENAGRPFMAVGEAVHRLTAEIADHLDIDAGRIEPGCRADIVVIDPQHLDESVEEVHEEPMERFGELRRIVRRNDATVRATFINGQQAWSGSEPAPGLGTDSGFGRVLPRRRAGDAVNRSRPVTGDLGRRDTSPAPVG